MVNKKYLKQTGENYDYYLDKSAGNKKFASREIIQQNESLFHKTTTYAGSNQMEVYDKKGKVIYNSDTNVFDKKQTLEFIDKNASKDVEEKKVYELELTRKDSNYSNKTKYFDKEKAERDKKLYLESGNYSKAEIKSSTEFYVKEK